MRESFFSTPLFVSIYYLHNPTPPDSEEVISCVFSSFIRIPEDFITDFSSVVFGNQYVDFTTSGMSRIGISEQCYNQVLFPVLFVFSAVQL